MEIINKIAAAKINLDKIRDDIEMLNKSLQGEDGKGGKKGELDALETEIKNKCWAQKQRHDAKLQGAFEGYRNSAEKFRAKILQECASNTATVEALIDLEKKAETVFGPTPTIEKSIPNLDINALLEYEADPILKKRIIGKNDVNIAAMIKKLGNSDWVREGRVYYDINERVCPFCQKPTDEAFAQSLNEYFDEAFEADSKSIDDLITNYKTESSRIQQQLISIINDPSKFIDADKLRVEKELLDSIINGNIQKLTAKKKEPSQIVELHSLSNVATTIKGFIDASNVLVDNHNKMVNNLSKERSDLTAQIWKYLIEVELKADLDAYRTKRDTLNKAIAGITDKITSATNENKKTSAEIRDLEKQTTSIQPTIDGINSLLSTFGFQSFQLSKAYNEKCYKLVRADGTDAKSTLSEGEKISLLFSIFIIY